MDFAREWIQFLIVPQGYWLRDSAIEVRTTQDDRLAVIASGHTQLMIGPPRLGIVHSVNQQVSLQ